MVKKQKSLSELSRERTYSRWGETSFYLAALFLDQQNKLIPQTAIVTAIHELHLNKKISTFSESAVRALLWRFKRDSLITEKGKLSRKGITYYSVTSKGLHIFTKALEYYGKISSLKGGYLAQLPSTQLTSESVDIGGSELVRLVMSEWGEHFDWEGAWLEGASMVFVTDGHIAKKLDEHCDKRARKRSAGSKSHTGFKLNVWPTTAKVRLWPKRISIEKDLLEWLVEECKLEYNDLRLFFLSVQKGCTESDSDSRSAYERYNSKGEFLQNRLGNGSFERVGSVSGESSQTRCGSMVRHGACEGLHQSLRSNCQCDLAQVLRATRVTGADSRRRHERSADLERGSRCPATASEGTHGYHPEVNRCYGVAAIAGGA